MRSVLLFVCPDVQGVVAYLHAMRTNENQCFALHPERVRPFLFIWTFVRNIHLLSIMHAYQSLTNLFVLFLYLYSFKIDPCPLHMYHVMHQPPSSSRVTSTKSDVRNARRPSGTGASLLCPSSCLSALTSSSGSIFLRTCALPMTSSWPTRRREGT